MQLYYKVYINTEGIKAPLPINIHPKMSEVLFAMGLVLSLFALLQSCLTPFKLSAATRGVHKPCSVRSIERDRVLNDRL